MSRLRKNYLLNKYIDLNGIPKVNINFDLKQNKDQKNINKLLQQFTNNSKADNDGSF